MQRCIAQLLRGQVGKPAFDNDLIQPHFKKDQNIPLTILIILFLVLLEK